MPFWLASYLLNIVKLSKSRSKLSFSFLLSNMLSSLLKIEAISEFTLGRLSVFKIVVGDCKFKAPDNPSFPTGSRWSIDN